MKYRLLGSTGLEVSVIGLGTAKFGASAPAEDCKVTIKRCLDLGINFVDTAYVYCNGMSEEIIGRTLAENGRRDEMVLCTKIQPMHNDRPTILAQAEESLRRLRTDRIDLLLLHRPNPDIPIEESLTALTELVQLGKVRFIGSSGFKAWQIMQALHASEQHGLEAFCVESSVYSLLCRHQEADLIPMLRTYGLGLTVWSPLGAGILTDQYTRDNPPGHMNLIEAQWAVIDKVREFAGHYGCTASQLAFAWVLAQPGVSLALAGVRTPDQIIDNAGAVDITIAAEDLEALDNVAPPGWTSQLQWLGLEFSRPSAS